MSRVRAINNGAQMIDNHLKAQTRKHTLAKAAAIGAAAGAVLYLAQKGKLNSKDGGNKFIETGKSILRKPAIAVLNGVKTVSSTLNAKLNQAAATKPWAKHIIENGKAVKRFASKVSCSLDGIANSAEKIFNKAKFAPNKAKAADLAAETFNNFVK